MTSPSALPPTHARLTPLADGQLRATEPTLFPFMAPRLQGDVLPNGQIKLSLWGAGVVATLTTTGWTGPYTFAPNRMTVDGGGVFVAQSRPVLLLRGTTLRHLAPATKSAWWCPPQPRARVVKDGARQSVAPSWGTVIVETRGDDLVVAIGADRAEAEAALALSAAEIIAQAEAYVARCDGLPEAEPFLRSMVSQSLHAALSSIRHDHKGGFAGLAAGQAYSTPARTYYRDGYWTHQALLAVCPEVLKPQIDILASGLQPDGEAPSGVIVSGPAQSEVWDVARRTDPRVREEHLRPLDWWSDHFDSPLFFVLTVADYVRATGDRGPLEKHWPAIAAIYRRYLGFTRDGNGLPLKPRHDRDWADNVYRGGYVAYDIGLWIGALDAIAELGLANDPKLAHAAAATAKTARANLDAALLQPAGWYADWRAVDEDFAEDHLTLDSLTLLRFDAVPSARAETILAKASELLESRHNAVQPYGDWGVLCAFPPFKRGRDSRAKSAFAYRYHNGSDWPYLSGLYADERLRRGLAGWRYPLTRWWQTCLEQGWMGAVEYFSPPFGRGSLLQGWSSMPAAVAMKYKAQVLAGEEDAIRH